MKKYFLCLLFTPPLPYPYQRILYVYNNQTSDGRSLYYVVLISFRENDKMETAVLLPTQSIIKKNSKFTDLLSSLFMKVKEKYFLFLSLQYTFFKRTDFNKPLIFFFCYEKIF